jgi:hypothetical protein
MDADTEHLLAEHDKLFLQWLNAPKEDVLDDEPDEDGERRVLQRGYYRAMALVADASTALRRHNSFPRLQGKYFSFRNDGIDRQTAADMVRKIAEAA